MSCDLTMNFEQRIKEAELRFILTYVAEDSCAEGGEPGYGPCDCVVCTAWRLQRRLWPADYPSVSRAEMAVLREALQGIPGYAHAAVNVKFQDGRSARVNFDC
jgi:hypothetical protein